MITFVYCFFCCLLIVCGHTTRFEREDNNAITNDSPVVLPKVVSSRYKAGADIAMKCNVNHQKHKINITWEFQHCLSNYKGLLCDPNSALEGHGDWKIINNTKGKRKLEIRNVREQDTGFYRCIYKNSIVKIFMIDVIVPAKYTGPPPQVISVIPSSNSVLPNTPLVIQCNVTSLMAAEIRWFKECSGRRCEVEEKGHCYCSIPPTNSAYSRNNNVYLSKLSIESLRSVDSGTYSCVAISVYGKDYKNVTIRVQDKKNSEETSKFSLLFLIPLSLVLVPVSIWLCFYRRRKKSRLSLNEHQKKLIKPVVKVDIVLEVDENV